MIIIMLLILSATSHLVSQIFDDHFIDKTLRVDYYHTGNSSEEVISIDHIYKYGVWAGSRKNLISKLDFGRYTVKLFDLKSGELIFLKGYDSYFGEYKTTDAALNGEKKTYHETALVPYPKHPVKLVIENTVKGKTKKIFEKEINSKDVIHQLKIDPLNIIILEDKRNLQPYQSFDIAVIGEGYSYDDIEKFKADFETFRQVMLSHEPYKSHKDRISIRGVMRAMEESGIDEPRAGIFKKSSLSATFNSFGSERYLLTEDNRALRNTASFVPYDAVLVIVNSHRYGGGGIYNFYATFTIDNQFHAYLILHEFGHSFAGLADEYYHSEASFNEFYPLGEEPVEPNITRLIGDDTPKWKGLLSPGIAVPTLWAKEEFDKSNFSWQEKRAEMNARIAKLKKEKATKAEIETAEKAYSEADKKNSDHVDKYLQSDKNWGKVGVFEGAGYCSKDVYRPMIDCIMFSKGHKPYCKVCEKAVEKVIKTYLDD